VGRCRGDAFGSSHLGRRARYSALRVEQLELGEQSMDVA
jgi:hypothetical protein